jgi:hypothetical protein
MVALLVSPAGAKPLDHLVPTTGIAEYEKTLADEFRDVFTSDVRLRVVVEPSFHEEYAVAVKQSASGYRILYVQATDYIWGALMTKPNNDPAPRPLLNKKLDNPIPVRECESDVPAGTAKRLELIWAEMLRKARPDDSGVVVMDGTNYNFSSEVDGEIEMAEATSPDEDTKPGALIAIAHTMRELCTTKSKALLDMLDEQTARLQNRLKQEEVK